MILLNEQMRIVNRLTPIKFSEDEFRLTEELTHNRIFKRLDSLEDDVLLDTYYNIKLNYFDACSDMENKYTYLLYTILLEVLEVRGADIKGYVQKKKTFVFTRNVIIFVASFVLFLCLSKFIYAQTALVLLNAFIVYRWKKIIIKAAKKFKVKQMQIQEYKISFASLFLIELLLLIFGVRNYNSVLYLLFGNLYILFVYRYIMKKSKTEKALMFEEKWKSIVLQVVKVLILVFILANSVRPVLDTFGMLIRSSNYQYIEGICLDVKDLPFGFKKGKVNNVEVVLADRNNLEVGNLYRIVYGKFTSAVIDVEQINVKSDNSSSESINKQIDELIEDSKREEAKRKEIELEKEKEKESK